MAIHISLEENSGRGRGKDTSEADALIVRFVDEELDNFLGHQLAGFTNTDRKFARRTFGDSDVAIIFGELDGIGFYHQNLEIRWTWKKWERGGEGSTVYAHILQGECQAAAVKDDNVALEGSSFEMSPDASVKLVR